MNEKARSITKEEAIEVIKAYQSNLTKSVSNQLYGDIQAFDMAIKALEEQGKWKAVCPMCGTEMEVIGSMTEVRARHDKRRTNHLY